MKSEIDDEFSRAMRDFNSVHLQSLIGSFGSLVTPPKEPQPQKEIADSYALMPPFECFASIGKATRHDHFYSSVGVGDVIVARVESVKELGGFLRALYCEKGPRRYISDLDIFLLCPSACLPERRSHRPEKGDTWRVQVQHVDLTNFKILVSFHSNFKDDLDDDDDISDVLSPAYKRTLMVEKSGVSYDQMLHKIVGFSNPRCVETLTKLMNIKSTPELSIWPQIAKIKTSKLEDAETLRREQNQRRALRSVGKGVGCFKQEQYVEAMQHLNHAVEIDAKCVEALVARGALHARLEVFQSALDDLRLALQIKPTHRNASKYLLETYVTFAQAEEKKEKFLKAEKLYLEALDLYPDESVLSDGLQKLRDARAAEEAAAATRREASKPQPELISPVMADRLPAEEESATAKKIQKWLKKEKNKLRKKNKESKKKKTKERKTLSISSPDGECEKDGSSRKSRKRNSSVTRSKSRTAKREVSPSGTGKCSRNRNSSPPQPSRESRTPSRSPAKRTRRKPSSGSESPVVRMRHGSRVVRRRSGSELSRESSHKPKVGYRSPLRDSSPTLPEKAAAHSKKKSRSTSRERSRSPKNEERSVIKRRGKSRSSSRARSISPMNRERSEIKKRIKSRSSSRERSRSPKRRQRSTERSRSRENGERSEIKRRGNLLSSSRERPGTPQSNKRPGIKKRGKSQSLSRDRSQSHGKRERSEMKKGRKSLSSSRERSRSPKNRERSEIKRRGKYRSSSRERSRSPKNRERSEIKKRCKSKSLSRGRSTSLKKRQKSRSSSRFMEKSKNSRGPSRGRSITPDKRQRCSTEKGRASRSRSTISSTPLQDEERPEIMERHSSRGKDSSISERDMKRSNGDESRNITVARSAVNQCQRNKEQYPYEASDDKYSPAFPTETPPGVIESHSRNDATSMRKRRTSRSVERLSNGKNATRSPRSPVRRKSGSRSGPRRSRSTARSRSRGRRDTRSRRRSRSEEKRNPQGIISSLSQRFKRRDKSPDAVASFLSEQRRKAHNE